MRITFVLRHTGLAGGNRVIGTYAGQLKKRGHEVLVVSLPTRPLTLLKRKIKTLLKEKKQSPLERGPSYFDGIDIEHRILEKYRPITDDDVPDADAVIATWWETAEWVAALKGGKGKKFYFIQDYGAPGQELDRIVPTWSLPLHRITISRWLADLIQSHVANAGIDIVPNSVDHNHFDAPLRGKQPVPTAGFVYRSMRSKGADIVFKACKQVLRHRPDFRLIAFGPEPAPEVKYGRFDYFRLPQETDLPKIYAGCDMWLFASRIEGFGLPILEAMACRTPVIATPAGAAPELLSNGGGILLDDFTAESMAEAMLKIGAMPATNWQAMSGQAYESAKIYTWDDATDLFEKALKKTI